MPQPSLPAYLDHPTPVAIAHRGGGGERHAENSLAAIAAVRELGYHHVELDLRATRDGVPVLFHDETLERMTGWPGGVEDRTWSELEAVHLPGGEAIPRLEEALTLWPDLRVALDFKSDAVIEPVAALVRRLKVGDRVGLGTSSQSRLSKLRAVFGPSFSYALGPVGVLRLRLASFGLPAGGFAPGTAQVPTHHHGIRIVDPWFLRAAHARGLQVQVWTINEAAEMDRLLGLGVDGLMTDRPTTLKQIMLERGCWTGD